MSDVPPSRSAGQRDCKRLVVFCDGTWNKEDQKSQNGQPCPTNVLRLFELTRIDDGNGCPQVAYYVRGVGTRWDERITGGGFGYGISDNIKDAYRFLVSNYAPGDEIFLFGFSRGAYTVRSLAGMIYNVGILQREYLHLVDEAFSHYRSADPQWHPDSQASKDFRNAYTNGGEEIKFLGVWDTVGALGAPFGVVMGWLLNQFFPTQFHDTKISPIILNAYHAASIDEKRWPFRPTRMELTLRRKQEAADLHATGDRSTFNYEEAWFPGVHSDVGGGYEDSSLSDCALKWMVDKAKAHGLSVRDYSDVQSRAFHPDPLAALHNSQTIWYQWTTKIYVYWPKALLKIIRKNEAQLIDRVQANGDFIRQIDHSPALAASIDQFPMKNDFEIDLSDCTREKLAKDTNYWPLNLARDKAPAGAPAVEDAQA
ncbi:DUF2235 domain-containing protein [Methylocystis sp. MJC1]|uniref:DUF2235 domain-containing protein n=1 Tax=Methylocystis sp. MJC1 TaxID=2654282 RepID=UPI0013EA5396|nr:DUF2235 domain-containing protein [Methylocystis sp. MJC1]KAF2991332.1 hypothetical protein MJC1_01681 [Methylocystis sp. MJC1]MBU6526129.1 DUF2235 domain-containing protein [Methylocystis sp. MJC1]UZX12583.1 DUF2235 domain-containing protein [Methylocystis sp. MJC1]